MEEKDREEEMVHITSAPVTCGCLCCLIEKSERNKRKKLESERKMSKLTRINPKAVWSFHMSKASEGIVRLMQKHSISISMQPHYMLRKALVHPNVENENTCGVV